MRLSLRLDMIAKARGVCVWHQGWVFGKVFLPRGTVLLNNTVFSLINLFRRLLITSFFAPSSSSSDCAG